MLRDLLLILNMLVCLALIGVVLLQRSEGGALGSGSPTGLVTARGAGDLLTRTTWVLFSLFLALSLALTLLGGHERSSQAILQRLKSQSINPDALPKPAPAPAPGASPDRAAPPPVQLPPLQRSQPAPAEPPVVNPITLPPLSTAPSKSPAP
jgi:preprotein translocase subunit SecG